MLTADEEMPHDGFGRHGAFLLRGMVKPGRSERILHAQCDIVVLMTHAY